MPEKCPLCDVAENLRNGGHDDRVITSELNVHFFSMYDGSPVSPGQCVIVSRYHITSLSDLNPMEWDSFSKIFVETKEIINKRFYPSGYKYVCNERMAAGATEEHFQFHLIPIYTGNEKSDDYNI